MENKTKQIEKPISLAIEECKANIAEVINNSQLSPVVLDLILKSIYDEVHNIYIQQLNQERQEYNTSMQDEQNDIKIQNNEEQSD